MMTENFQFTLQEDRRRRAPRRNLHAARHDPHAGLHAGRHRRHRQGDVSRPGARDRRRHHPRQYLSSDAAPGGRARRAARRPAQADPLGAPDPDRLRRLPGHVAVAACASSTSRASPSSRMSTAALHHMSPERSIEIQGLLGSDIQMQLDECVALPAEPQGNRARHGAVAALGRALQGRLRRAAGQGDVRHRAGRRHPGAARPLGRGADASSTSRAMRSAAWRSASRRT